MWATYDGILERETIENMAGVTFPRGRAIIVNAGGLLWGGLVRDGSSQVLRVGGQSYVSGTVPGSIIRPGVVENPENPDVRIYRVRRDWSTSDLKADASEFFKIPLIDVKNEHVRTLRDLYQKDWIEWPWQKGAPYYERNGIPGYQPDAKGILDSLSDEPGLGKADQVIWFVANDLNSSATRSLYGSLPIGLEMQVTCWAYKHIEELQNVIFQRYRIIYKGSGTTPSTARIDSMYFAKWVDPDIGNYSNDFVGCDVERGMGYAYNAEMTDVDFTKHKMVPAVVGYDFLQGPRNPKIGATARWGMTTIDDYENLPLTSFTYFNSSSRQTDHNIGNYSSTRSWWNLYRGYRAEPLNPPVCFVDPVTDRCTSFELNGDPHNFSGWVDGISDPADDRRFAIISGPCTIAFGDTQEVVIGLIAGIGNDNRDGINVIKNIDDAAQDAFNLNFDFPDKVPAPNVRIVELDNKIILDWESDTAQIRKIESYNSKGYKFETYKIYQLPSPSASKTDGIIYTPFDRTQPRYLELTADKFRNRTLVNGQKYYFAVTATAYNPEPTVTKKRIESALNIYQAVPHSPNPGTIYPYSADSKISEVWDNVGFNNAEVRINYYDISKSDGNIHKILFHRNSDPIVDFHEKPKWSLIDSTKNDTLLNRLPVDISPQRVITKGFTIQVMMPFHGLRTVTQALYNYQPTRELVFNQPNSAGNFMVLGPGSSILDTLKGQRHDDYDIELTFTGDSSWTFFMGSLAPTSRFVRVPFQAWEVKVIGNDTIRRQLYTTVTDCGNDSVWRPVDILNRTYNGKPVKTFYPLAVIVDSTRMWVHDVGQSYYIGGTYHDDVPWRMDYLYHRIFLFLGGFYYSNKVSISRVYIADIDDDGIAAPPGTTIRFEHHKEIRNRDEKLFISSPVITDDLNAAREEIKKVNVFPNPYYGMNRAEVNRYQRFVTFNHLPKYATIRIFNIAGILVRTIKKDDETQFTTWDLNNYNGLPVASGLYIAHLELRHLNGQSLGDKILKLMIVPEDQSPGNQ